jgi:type IV pilus assembly protein PilN
LKISFALRNRSSTARFEAEAVMRVRLNLATKPLESHRRFLAGSGLAAFAAALVFAALGWHVYIVRQADAEMRARSDKIGQEVIRYQQQRSELEGFFQRKDIASLHDRAAFINGIIDARSFNWTQMFMDLEGILPGGVRILSIEPKQAAGHAELKLTIGASSDEAKLKFIRALEESRQFSSVQEQWEHAPSGTNNPSGDQRVIQLTTDYFGT